MLSEQMTQEQVDELVKALKHMTTIDLQGLASVALQELGLRAHKQCNREQLIVAAVLTLKMDLNLFGGPRDDSSTSK